MIVVGRRSAAIDAVEEAEAGLPGVGVAEVRFRSMSSRVWAEGFVVGTEKNLMGLSG